MQTHIGLLVIAMLGTASSAETLSRAEATMLAALVAALVALTTSILTTLAQLRMHRSAGLLEQEAALVGDLRTSITAFATEIAKASHSMCWLTWAATKRRGDSLHDQDLPYEKVKEYDEEMHIVLPSISGWLSTIAALDSQSFSKLEPIADRIFRMDVRVGNAGEALRRDRDQGTDELAKLHKAVKRLDRKVRKQVAGSVKGRLPSLFAELEDRRKKSARGGGSPRSAGQETQEMPNRRGR